MQFDQMTAQLLEETLQGDVDTAVGLMERWMTSGHAPEQICEHVVWKVIEQVETLERRDSISKLQYNYSVLLIHQIIDLIQSRYARCGRNGMTLLLFCGRTQLEQLAGQLMADLADASGYDVRFAGGGVAADEVLAEVGRIRPAILLLFGSNPSDAPEIRQVIDLTRSVASCPDLQIVVGGGVFNRAPGLAEEIGADLWGNRPLEILQVIQKEPGRRADHDVQRTVGKNRRAVA